jgi:phosphoribosylamine--glycine ligase
MRVLVVGAGAREHALAWGLRRSPSVSELLCAPGNAGIERLARCVPVAADQSTRLADLAAAERVDLVVVGPEAPLVSGLTDLLEAQGRAVFGCSRAAAELEGSKSFAKTFMARHQIPTAAFGAFSELAEARLFVDAQFQAGAARLVVKADGLCAGKGVVICDSVEEAHAACARMFEGALGDAGRRVVIEEFLDGREASLMALCDGEHVAPLQPAEDHKQIHDGDQGPMTGGMGVVSPTPVMSDLDVARALKEVLEPTARGMAAEGRPFRGLLYAGLMLTASGPRVLEFNCRFGDPETEALIVRLDPAQDLAQLLFGVATGRPPARVRFSERVAVCVVIAAGGYPGPYDQGRTITGVEQAEALPDVVVFHAGTRRDGDRLVTAGGRVLVVSALGDDAAEARARAYQAVDLIRFEGAQHRRDIGARRAGSGRHT